MIFKRIEIQLTRPICKCQEQQLAWGLGDKNQLIITCKSCGVDVRIPYSQLKAIIQLDESYPGEQQERPKGQDCEGVGKDVFVLAEAKKKRRWPWQKE